MRLATAAWRWCIAQGFGSSLLGSFVAPVVLVAFATTFGWRTSFFLAGAPGIVTAILIVWLIRETPTVPAATQTIAVTGRASRREALEDRNIILCALLGVLLVSYLVVCWAFMPLYLTQERHYEASTMGWIMGMLGISATLASFAIPALSDRIGRRPLMILMPFIAIMLPLAALYFTGPAWMLAAIFFVGWGVTGAFPLFMATIPSESVDVGHMTAALGICMGTGEILGGVLSPLLAGYAADRVGLQAPLWMMAGLAVVATLISIGLRETAPHALARVTPTAAAGAS